MGNMRYKGYTGSVEYNEENNCLFGKVQGLGNKVLLSYEGESIEEIRKDFEDTIDMYFESCTERGIVPVKPYSGKLIVRMPSELHSRIAGFATATGTTINDFINRAVTNELSHSAI